MHRQPTAGDCITIAGQRCELIVVSAERIPEEHGLQAMTFITIKEKDLGKENPKITLWQTEGFTEFGTFVKLGDITLIRQVKVKRVVRYDVK